MKNTYQSLEAIKKLRILGASRDFWRTSCRQKSDLMKTAEYSKMAAMQGSSWWFKGRKDMLADMMGEYFGIVGGCRVLDIGCGTGSNIAALARIGKATGVDNSKTAVEYCRKTGIEARLGSALKLPFESGIFDVAVMADVLEHIGNEKKAIAEARRVLRKDGILIITVPAYQALFSYHDRAVGHKRGYSKKSLRGCWADLMWNIRPIFFLLRLFRQLQPGLLAQLQAPANQTAFRHGVCWKRF